MTNCQVQRMKGKSCVLFAVHSMSESSFRRHSRVMEQRRRQIRETCTRDFLRGQPKPKLFRNVFFDWENKLLLCTIPKVVSPDNLCCLVNSFCAFVGRADLIDLTCLGPLLSRFPARVGRRSFSLCVTPTPTCGLSVRRRRAIGT